MEWQRGKLISCLGVSFSSGRVKYCSRSQQYLYWGYLCLLGTQYPPEPSSSFWTLDRSAVNVEHLRGRLGVRIISANTNSISYSLLIVAEPSGITYFLMNLHISLWTGICCRCQVFRASRLWVIVALLNLWLDYKYYFLNPTIQQPKTILNTHKNSAWDWIQGVFFKHIWPLGPYMLQKQSS